MELKDVMKGPDTAMPLQHRLELEIKAVTNIRDFALARAKIDAEYAKKIGVMNTKFNGMRFDSPASTRDEYPENSGAVRVFHALLDYSITHQGLLHDMSGDTEAATIDWLTSLIDAKNTVKSEWVDTRKRLDAKMDGSLKEYKVEEKKYEKACADMNKSIDKMEKVLDRGAKVDKVMESRFKYTDTAQTSHNRYVLAMERVNVETHSMYEDVLPRALDGLHKLQKHHVRDLQAGLVQLIDKMDVTNQPFQAMFKDLRAEIGSLDPGSEYAEFLSPFEQDQYAHETPEDEIFVPRQDIESEEIGSGQENPLFKGEICMFQATEFPLEELDIQYQDKLQEKEEELKGKQMFLDECKADLTVPVSDNAALVSSADRTARAKKIDVFIDISATEVEIAEINCDIAILKSQIAKIGFEQLGENAPEEYHDRGAFGGTSSRRTGRAGRRAPSGGAAAASARPTSRGSSGTPARPPSSSGAPTGRALPPPPGGGASPARPLPPKPEGKVNPVKLEDEGYFHGKIGRRDVDPLLKKVGDYLVRESQKKLGELALSVKTPEKVTHYIIQQDIPGKFRFEGDAYDSVDILISHYRDSGQSVTKRSDAVLKTPVNRAGFSGGAGDKWHMTHSDIRMGKKLGNGNFGEVLLGTLVKTGEKCAIKSCKDTVPDPGRFLEEADVLKEYEHPNIVQLYGVVSTKPILIVLELCEGGELLVYLRKHSGMIETGVYVRMGSEAGAGMNYLHSKHCIHRDLAARNCLVTKDGVVKISDFGMSRLTEGDDDIYTVNTSAKTIPIKWTAPEALEHMSYVLATDVWAFGILLWEIFSGGKMPYPGMNNSETKEAVIKKGYRMPPPHGCPEQVTQLMDECWAYREQDRPTMADICDYFVELLAFYPDESGL